MGFAWQGNSSRRTCRNLRFISSNLMGQHPPDPQRRLHLPGKFRRGSSRVPQQYPSFGFFGYACEIDNPQDLKHWCVQLCTANLYRIGKGQLPAGLIAPCRSPKVVRLESGGNDALQRMCRTQGIARGKEGITTMNSGCATISYVAATQQVFKGLMTYATENQEQSGLWMMVIHDDYCLVVWNVWNHGMNYDFPFLLWIILPTDELHHFSEG